MAPASPGPRNQCDQGPAADLPVHHRGRHRHDVSASSTGRLLVYAYTVYSCGPFSPLATSVCWSQSANKNPNPRLTDLEARADLYSLYGVHQLTTPYHLQFTQLTRQPPSPRDLGTLDRQLRIPSFLSITGSNTTASILASPRLNTSISPSHPISLYPSQPSTPSSLSTFLLFHFSFMIVFTLGSSS